MSMGALEYRGWCGSGAGMTGSYEPSDVGALYLLEVRLMANCLSCPTRRVSLFCFVYKTSTTVATVDVLTKAQALRMKSNRYSYQLTHY